MMQTFEEWWLEQKGTPYNDEQSGGSIGYTAKESARVGYSAGISEGLERAAVIAEDYIGSDVIAQDIRSAKDA